MWCWCFLYLGLVVVICGLVVGIAGLLVLGLVNWCARVASVT